jgi:photosystem II stability/assembly factor-like uncharacterized protein
MKSKLILCLALVLSGGLFVGCAVVKEHSASISNPTGAENFISDIQMLDASNGWAQTGDPDDFRVLHTTDGGQTWSDVTPRPLPAKVWDCVFPKCHFPKPQMAWISYYDKKTCLLLTTNGGKSWLPWKPLGTFDNDIHNYFLGYVSCRFLNASDGLADSIDGSAGSTWHIFFETHDGGLTWKPVRPDDQEPSATIGVSDINPDRMGFYPPANVIIAHGDMDDEKPKDAVRLSISTNLGQSWRDVSLPLPSEKYREGLVVPEEPVFLDARHVWLPAHIIKENANGSLAWNVLVFYATDDGGWTWTPRPGMVEFGTNHIGDERQLDIVSARDIFVCDGPDLYVTHNGAQSWQTIKPNIDFDRMSSNGGVAQIDFVDATHGWAVHYDTFDRAPHDKYYLYKTSDGGANWVKLPLKIIH